MMSMCLQNAYKIKSTALVSIFKQSVRYRRRKPRWLPRAKSKEFYVREATPRDPEEFAILKEKYYHYKVAVKSLSAFLAKEIADEDALKTTEEKIETADDFQSMATLSAQFNSKIAIQRETRQEEEAKAEDERIARLSVEFDEHKLERALEASKRVEKEKTVLNKFVQEENLEMAIEKLLDSRTDYNFAIAKGGNVLEGEIPEYLKQSENPN